MRNIVVSIIIYEAEVHFIYRFRFSCNTVISALLVYFMSKNCVLKIMVLQPDGTYKASYQQFNYGLSESFGMTRTTDGVGWVHKFTGNEIKMLFELLQYEEKTTGVVTLGSTIRKDICDHFGLSYRYLLEVLESLERKRGIVRKNRNELMLNPMYLYKGGSTNFIKKMDKFVEQELKNREKNEAK